MSSIRISRVATVVAGAPVWSFPALGSWFTLGGWPAPRAWPVLALWPDPDRSAVEVRVNHTDDAMVVAVRVDGLDAQDYSAHVDGGWLHIEGRRETGGPWGRRSVAFQRSFRLPQGLDASAAQGGFSDGWLTIRVPRVAPERRVVPIRVKSSAGEAPRSGAPSWAERLRTAWRRLWSRSPKSQPSS